MDKNNQIEKYRKSIGNWFYNIIEKLKKRFFPPKKMWDKDTEDRINKEFPNEIEQSEAKELLEELLSRNRGLLETLDIRMLNKQYVNMFGKARLERIISNDLLQQKILEISEEQLPVYNYILNYKLTNFNERVLNLSIAYTKNLSLDEFEALSEKDKLKAVSILASNSSFGLYSLLDLEDYYQKRKEMCQNIINNPKQIEEELRKFMENEDGIYDYPFGFLNDMELLNEVDRVKNAIVEAKYGMTLTKAKNICKAFGNDIENVQQSESTRIVQELKAILEEDSIDRLRQINLDENYANYEGTIDIISKLSNAYLHEYQKTLYKISENDFIESQRVKTKGKKVEVKIYNALGKNNDRADFNMILTSLGGIYPLRHNYKDLKADWDRANKNHTISCSYIGNDFLGIVSPYYLLAFSDIGENELLISNNGDAGTCGFEYDFYGEDLLGSNFLTPKNEINSSKIYNELLIERKVEQDGKLVNRTPTFAVFMAKELDDIHDNKDYRWNETKRLAAELGIPIVVIDESQCLKLEFEKVQDMVRRVKEERRMDLIPEIIHKIENNKAAQGGELIELRNKIFSVKNVKKLLDEIIGTIITSGTENFNQGIEQMIRVTEEVRSYHKEERMKDDFFGYKKGCKTYDYDQYLKKLKVLLSTKNKTNDVDLPEVRDNQPEKSNEGIEI